MTTMELKSGTLTPAGYPTLKRVPDGVPIPPAVRETCDAYLTARDELDQVYNELRAAAGELEHATRADMKARRVASESFEVESEIDAREPAARARLEEAQRTYAAAQAAATSAELAYASAMFDSRVEWLAEIDTVRSAARDRVQDLLAELGTALRDQYGLHALERVLKAWQHRRDATDDARLQHLHSGAHRSAPDFQMVADELSWVHGKRMENVRFAVERPPLGRMR